MVHLSPHAVVFSCTQCSWRRRLKSRSDALMGGYNHFAWCPDCGADVTCVHESGKVSLLDKLVSCMLSEPTPDDAVNYMKQSARRGAKSEGDPND